MLAHGAVLRKNFLSQEQLIALVKDYRSAGLSDEEVAIMAFSQKVAGQANQIEAQDVEELRRHGLSEEEILDIILVAAVRSFFSKTLDATGAQPDEVYLELGQEFLELAGYEDSRVE